MSDTTTRGRRERRLLETKKHYWKRLASGRYGRHGRGERPAVERSRVVGRIETIAIE